MVGRLVGDFGRDASHHLTIGAQKCADRVVFAQLDEAVVLLIQILRPV